MKRVPPAGPLGAKLLLVGEAPGPTELAKGYPFAGVTGGKVRGVFNYEGLGQIRAANVFDFQAKLPESMAGRAALVAKHWDTITPELQQTKAKVIVACGWCAMYRLTGIRAPIIDETGGVLRADEIPREIYLRAGEAPLRTGIPEGALVVIAMHPAAVMRTKTEVRWMLVQKALRRAARYANGGLKYTERRLRVNRGIVPEQLDAVLSKADTVVLDNEFDRVTKVPFMTGMTVDGKEILSFDPRQGFQEVLQKHLLRSDLLKVAHYHQAEVESFRALGIETRAPWFDTLLAFNTIYPGLPVGLENVAQFYLDGARNWKRLMSTEDPAYNAIDVDVTWACFQEQRIELVKYGLKEVFDTEVMPVSLLAMGLEGRGLQVNGIEQARMLHEESLEAEEILGELQALVEERFEKRAAPLLEAADRMLADERKLRNTGMQCPVHPGYEAERMKRWASKEECICQEIWRASSPIERKGLKSDASKLLGRVKKWREKGYNPKSPQDNAWLLYSKDGFGLPEQRKDGKVTTNADAIARLLALKGTQKEPLVVEVLTKIKKYQHLEKMRGTFMQPPVDDLGVAHPPVRIHGTDSGRPASGQEGEESDKAASQYAYNAFNIPEEVRSLFVPRRQMRVSSMSMSTGGELD